MIPGTLTKAQVISTNPDLYSVNVYLASQAGEGPVSPVRVLVTGACDGVRINQTSLPQPGTLGVVAALDNDARTLVWLGALPLNANDAITVLPGQSAVEYLAHWSGYYSILDQGGNLTQEFPDGTTFQVGPTANTPTKHVVNGTTGLRELISVAQSDRVASVPSAFPCSYTHPTGTKISVDISGNVTIYGASNITVSGQTNILVESTTINVNGTTSVDITAPAINIGASGATEYYLMDQRTITVYNEHTHPTPSGTSSPPNQTMSIGSETTTNLKAS